MPPGRVLTIGGPPAYLRALVATGTRVDRLTEPSTDLLVGWNMAHELHDAVRLLRRDQAYRTLERGAYDAVLCHAIRDLGTWIDAGPPVVLVLHERRSLLDLFDDGPASWDQSTVRALERVTIVCAADDVARSWAFDGSEDPSLRDEAVIRPAVSVDDWPRSAQSSREAVTAAPFALERAVLDTAYLLSILSASPGITVLGANPSLGLGTGPASPAARRRTFARARVYVNLSNPEFELAAPMPMLEAMAAGLPVVTLAHDSSPIADGENGLIARSAGELSAKTSRLLDDEALSQRLGSNARETIEQRYSQQTFTARWSRLLTELTPQFT